MRRTRWPYYPGHHVVSSDYMKDWELQVLMSVALLKLTQTFVQILNVESIHTSQPVTGNEV